MAKWLHAPHLGIEKTLARARMLYYWPNMNKEIKELVESCSICEQFKSENQKEPLVQDSPPGYPFHKVSMDLFEYAGQDYIALIDAYSGLLIVENLNRKTAGHIIEKITTNFNKYGYPTIIRSDNSPFNSGEFDEFCRTHNIVMQFSSRRYPQSNGLAEKAVAIAKNILKRCHEANDLKNYQYRILEYNTTPVAGMKFVPSQLFFGRLLKTRLPLAQTLLCRNSISEEVVQNNIKTKI